MIVLDTDVFTLLSRSTTKKQAPDLVERLERQRTSVYVSAVTAEEVLRGALALIRKEETTGKGTAGYSLLVFLLSQLNQYPILPYSEVADRLYRSFSAVIKRNGSADCKIAATAIIHGATVITRNTRHFSQIPNVAFEDWTTDAAED